jgi:hypothetical protein
MPSALGGTRTPNLLIRSQMLYPLSYERSITALTCGFAPPTGLDAPRPEQQPTTSNPKRRSRTGQRLSFLEGIMSPNNRPE